MKKSIEIEHELSTLEEVAEHLRLKLSTIRGYCRENRIPCLKFGSVYRVRREVLRGLMSGEVEVKPKS